MRYLALATAIVGVVLAGIVWLGSGLQRSSPRVAYASSSASPGPPGGRDLAAYVTPPPVTGDAPWALSALPECFRQVSYARGTAAFVRAHRPADARPLPPGTTADVADCRLAIGARGIAVTRGENALRVPPPARLSRAGALLVLETRDGSRREVRVYRLAPGATLRLRP